MKSEGQNFELANDNQEILTCVYCGKQYPLGTPPWGSKVLTDHIQVCEKHPMSQLKKEKAELRKALIWLVGVESEKELEGMRTILSIAPPDSDMAKAALNAVEVLLRIKE